jgi:hypothetical protein
MSGTRWAERLTPVSAGMTLALLVVAAVVQPAFGQESGACTRCLEQYRRQASVTVCKGLVGYYYEQCLWNHAAANCVATAEHPNRPCGNPPGGSGGSVDCSLPECNFADGVPNGSLCDWSCWNKTCGDAGNPSVCLDRQKKCHPKDTSLGCVECRCYE